MPFRNLPLSMFKFPKEYKPNNNSSNTNDNNNNNTNADANDKDSNERENAQTLIPVKPENNCMPKHPCLNFNIFASVNIDGEFITEILENDNMQELAKLIKNINILSDHSLDDPNTCPCFLDCQAQYIQP